MIENAVEGSVPAGLAMTATSSVVTFVVYGIDKAAAKRGRARVPESILHLLALLGGWPGALLGMALFRHKRRKIGFVAVTWLIALVHVAGWAWLLTRARG